MTTSFEAVIVHPDANYAKQAAMAVFAEISRIERLLSRFDPGTDLAQVNRLRPGEWMRVNLEVVECLEIAARAYVETGGAYDAAYRSRQGGGRRSAMDYLLLSRPDADEPDAPADFLAGLAPGAAQAGFGTDMEIPLPARRLDADKSTDPTPPDGANLDLGGIGKGYALDKCQQILDDWQIDNALLSAGTSTVLARGDGPEGNGWVVGVSGDYADLTGVETTALRSQALSGSGTGVKGEHIRTPQSGAAAGALASWALAESAAWTDALSTAFMVMDRAAALEFMARHTSSCAAIALYRNEEPLVAGQWVDTNRK